VKTILVIDFSVNWYDLFRRHKMPSGEEIVIEQTEWRLLDCAADASAPPGKRLVASIQPSSEPYPGTKQGEHRVVHPDAVLIRNFPRGLHEVDYRNLLLTMAVAGVPAVNTISSTLLCQERPLLYAELLRVRDKLGEAAFPLISAQMFSNLTASSKPLVPPSLPLVAKVSNTHAGFGKMQFAATADGAAAFEDFRSVLALHKDYFTTESLVPNVATEYRVQRIGSHCRVYRRQSDSGWKGNWGNIRFESLPTEGRHETWAAECAKIFGGLDILALDVLVDTEGKETIIELNDTACGLMYEFEHEDCARIRDLLVDKLSSPTVS
jgi:hypothetical protein